MGGGGSLTSLHYRCWEARWTIQLQCEYFLKGMAKSFPILTFDYLTDMFPKLSTSSTFRLCNLELLRIPIRLCNECWNAICDAQKSQFVPQWYDCFIKTIQALKMYESDKYPSGDETMARTFHFPRPFVTTRIRIDQLEGALYKLFKVRNM